MSILYLIMSMERKTRISNSANLETLHHSLTTVKGSLRVYTCGLDTTFHHH